MSDTPTSGGKGATPRPWAWHGEDYRGGWGWQLLVGPSGEGIACGQADDGPYKNLRAFVPIEPRYCKTGLMADDECAPAIHIRQLDAEFLLRAVNAYDDMLAALCEYVDFGASSKAYEMGRAAIAKAKGAAP